MAATGAAAICKHTCSVGSAAVVVMTDSPAQDVWCRVGRGASTPSPARHGRPLPSCPRRQALRSRPQRRHELPSSVGAPKKKNQTDGDATCGAAHHGSAARPASPRPVSRLLGGIVDLDDGHARGGVCRLARRVPGCRDGRRARGRQKGRRVSQRQIPARHAPGLGSIPRIRSNGSQAVHVKTPTKAGARALGLGLIAVADAAARSRPRQAARRECKSHSARPAPGILSTAGNGPLGRQAGGEGGGPRGGKAVYKGGTQLPAKDLILIHSLTSLIHSLASPLPLLQLPASISLPLPSPPRAFSFPRSHQPPPICDSSPPSLPSPPPRPPPLSSGATPPWTRSPSARPTTYAAATSSSAAATRRPTKLRARATSPKTPVSSAASSTASASWTSARSSTSPPSSASKTCSRPSANKRLPAASARLPT